MILFSSVNAVIVLILIVLKLILMWYYFAQLWNALPALSKCNAIGWTCDISFRKNVIWHTKWISHEVISILWKHKPNQISLETEGLLISGKKILSSCTDSKDTKRKKRCECIAQSIYLFFLNGKCIFITWKYQSPTVSSVSTVNYKSGMGDLVFKNL